VTSGKSWNAFVGRVKPLDQGCDRHGQIGVGGNLRQRAGEGRGAELAAVQRIEGCSDREAVDRFAFDARWKYTCGGLDFDYPGFVHTVLVDMRARLARSARPDRIFEVTLERTRATGLVGRRRVLDSTPLYDDRHDGHGHAGPLGDPRAAQGCWRRAGR
jgi:hypothetical protein